MSYPMTDAADIKNETTTVVISEIYNKFIGDDKRTALVRKNILLSLFVKGWSAIVVFLMVPLTLHCLGTYQNGIWLTISSLLVWIDNLDIGMGNGLRNSLASSVAKGNMREAREAVSSTFAMLVAIILPVCLLLCLLVDNTDIYNFLNVDKTLIPNLANTILVCLVFVCGSFVFKFVGNVYLGLQLPAVNNMLQAIGQTIALVLTYIVYASGSHSLFYIAASNTVAPLLAYLLSYPYTFCVKYKELRPSFRFVRKGMIKSLMSTGVIFFVIQISGALLFMSSNVLISRLFSPEYVTPYQIAYRYFYIPLLLFMIICTPFWSATTDAYARGDMAWIEESGRKLNKIVAVIVLGMVVMVLISRPFYNVWVGANTDIPFGITVMMAIYNSITITSLRYSLVLNGLGALRIQLITTLTAAVVFIPLSIFAVSLTNSLIGFMTVLCIVNTPGLILNNIQYNRIINKTAKGIWRV